MEVGGGGGRGQVLGAVWDERLWCMRKWQGMQERNGVGAEQAEKVVKVIERTRKGALCMQCKGKSSTIGWVQTRNGKLTHFAQNHYEPTPHLSVPDCTFCRYSVCSASSCRWCSFDPKLPRFCSCPWAPANCLRWFSIGIIWPRRHLWVTELASSGISALQR